ncbi:MAG: hypothetical protein AAF337_12395 [Pseudomonadota bacterium]
MLAGTLKLVENTGLSHWPQAEYALRQALSTAQHSPFAAALPVWALHRHVEGLYASRGAPLPQWALCPAFDQLRGRAPFDNAQVMEARSIVRQLSRLPGYGCQEARRTPDKADVQRALIIANVIDTTRFADTSKGDGPETDALGGPFALPPGPLDALWQTLQDLQAGHPPLLSALAGVEALEDYEMLFPGRVSLAQHLLWPVLLHWAFGGHFIFQAPTGNVSADKALLHIDKAADHFLEKHRDLENWYMSSLAACGQSRTGSLIPKVLQTFFISPLSTSQAIAEHLRCVRRTTESILSRLEQCGVVRCMQTSGRLKLWAPTNIKIF